VYHNLEDIEPIMVAAHIETLQRRATPPTVKQHMAAIRMLFSRRESECHALHEEAAIECRPQQGEARNALARAVFFHRLGEIRDRTFENQRYRASGLEQTASR
jgi:hypothetical protein